MATSARRTDLWFRLSIAFGVLLGLVLLVQTISTYFVVYHRIVEEEARRLADQKRIAVERAERMSEVHDLAGLTPILSELTRESSRQIAWMRVMNSKGTEVAHSGIPPATHLKAEELFQLLSTQEMATHIEMSGSVRLLVAISHLRPPRRAGSVLPADGGPFYIETAINMEGVSVRFGGLRRNLIIGCLAAFALIAAMVLMAVSFRRYQESRYLEQQMELARSVQNDLLPQPESALPAPDVVEFAAVSLPAATVGGDFYDVFRSGNGCLSIALGDVAGKGLSAALLMGVIHGAIRSMDWTESALHHEASSERLNRLLCERTARERFASLFWSYVSSDEGMLRYINAGHIPPLLFRNGENRVVERLEGGGPVLGMMPVARYSSGEIALARGDLLVVFSDGVLEATNRQGEEFGEERLAQTVQRHQDLSPRQICDAILADISKFLAGLRPHDDLTLLVLRLSPA